MDSKPRLVLNSHTLCETVANLFFSKPTNETMNAIVRENVASCSFMTANKADRINQLGLIKTDELTGSSKNSNRSIKKLFRAVMDCTKCTCDGFKELNMLCDGITKKAPATNRPFTNVVLAPQDSPHTNDELCEMLAENRRLELVISEYRVCVDFMIKAFHRKVTSEILEDRLDYLSAYSAKMWKLIGDQRIKIHNMTEVMKKAATEDEALTLKQTQEMSELRLENECLNELVKISREYGSLGIPNVTVLAEKGVQKNAQKSADNGIEDNVEDELSPAESHLEDESENSNEDQKEIVINLLSSDSSQNDTKESEA